MEDTSTSTIATEGVEQAAAVEATPAVAQPSNEASSGESGAARAAQSRQQMSAAMNGFLRSGATDEQPTSKPDDASSAGESTGADALDVKPADPFRGQDGRFLPRRAVPEIARQSQDEVERLQAELAARDPAKLREQHWQEFQQWQAQQQMAAVSTQTVDQQRQDAETFEASLRMSDSDPRLYEEAPNDPEGRTLYQWREDRKDLISRYPDAEQAIKAEADFKATSKLREQITASAQREGVDPARWKAQGVTWDSMAKDLADAREAKVRAEVQPALDELAQLRRDIQQYTPQALGAQRSPVAAGRSGDSVQPHMNQYMDSFLRGA